jgi:hypothetical protein
MSTDALPTTNGKNVFIVTVPNCPATLGHQGRGLDSLSCNASILPDLILFAPDLLSAKYLVLVMGIVSVLIASMSSLTDLTEKMGQVSWLSNILLSILGFLLKRVR